MKQFIEGFIVAALFWPAFYFLGCIMELGRARKQLVELREWLRQTHQP